MNMGRVFVTGDTHGNTVNEMSRFSSKKFKEGNVLTKKDVMIILGDFGFVWHNTRTKEEQYWIDWMNNKPWSWAFIDGNHDNIPLLNELPSENAYGGTVGVLADSIVHLRRGFIYTINNKTFFCLGGAMSIDKYRRTEGVSWWREEEPSYAEVDQSLISLGKNEFTVDYMLTHDCPSWIGEKIIRNMIESSTVKSLDEIFSIEELQFRHHYFGHHHIDKVLDKKHTVCYNSIIEV
jgi:predicted phosphodiesterase